MNTPASGWSDGILCLLAIFLPYFLLIAGALPFWDALRRSGRARAALAGVNATVVDLLRPLDFGLALVFWKLPPWLVVIGCGSAGRVIAIVALRGRRPGTASAPPLTPSSKFFTNLEATY